MNSPHELLEDLQLIFSLPWDSQLLGSFS